MLPAEQLRRLPAPALVLGGQFVRFAAVGVTNTAITLIAYAALIGAGLHYLGAIVPAFALGALNGYTLNRAWTFRAGGFEPTALARYVATQLFGLGLDALLLVAFIELLGAPRLLAQLLAAPLVSCATFAGSRWWVFAPRRARARAGTGTATK
jgi:putative flippase GtrA